MSEHPEDFCQKCGGPNGVVWFAPSDIWNRTVPEREAIWCPVCFIKGAEAAGIVPTGWRIAPEDLDASAEIIALRQEFDRLTKDAARWRKLRSVVEAAKGGASVEVVVNDHLSYYEEAKPGEQVKIQWYPDTPVGFYRVLSATLDEAVDALPEPASPQHETERTR